MSGPCPCGSGTSYDACCGPLLAGTRTAGTAEQLMRSRYTAFATGDTAYLLLSWHPATRPRRLDLDAGQRWTGLTLHASSGGSLLASEGTVEFTAHYVLGGREGDQHEVSRFSRQDGRWVYVGPA